MSIEELKKQFIMDGDAMKSRLEPLVTKALKRCTIDKKGKVLITDPKLSTRDQVVIVLVARAIASRLDSSISSDVPVAEIQESTGLPANQIRARGRDAIKARFAEAPARGVYRAIPHRIEAFLDSLTQTKDHKETTG